VLRVAVWVATPALVWAVVERFKAFVSSYPGRINPHREGFAPSPPFSLVLALFG
jgi:hypothetical protein